MTDFAAQRTKMVESQIRTEDVTDYRVLAAMGAVPRERFVPENLRTLAYIDEDLLLTVRGATPARYLMKPASFARLVQTAEIVEGDRVLDIGCATGYGAAVLARLAAVVVALESDASLAVIATATLRELGVANAVVVTGPFETGSGREAPYDVILIEGAVEIVPEALFALLREGGRLLAVIGYGRSAMATVYTKTEGEVGRRPAFDAYVRPLPGFERPKAFVF
jgi:protein-L-isoaspartate(D-aspartate) O-methyltransferase